MYVSIGICQSSQTLSITKRGFENEFEPDPNVYLKPYFTLQAMCIANGAGNNEHSNGLILRTAVIMFVMQIRQWKSIQ